MELTLVTLLAVVILPFGVGWWVGHPLFAALVFLALALTVALGTATRAGGDEDAAFGLALSLALSAAAAYAGGLVRQRRDQRNT